MNETATVVENEFILRRLADPFPLFPAEYGPSLWVIATALVVIFGGFVAMRYYSRERKACGAWTIPLALMRIGCYLLLAFAFLLPAIQRWETSEKRSRVVVVLDVSPSVVKISDEVGAAPGTKQKTRMDQVLEFLTDEQVGFMKKLLEKNPVVVYRFGARLDEEPSTIDPVRGNWSRAEWDSWVNYDFKPWLLKGVSIQARESIVKMTAWKGTEPGNADWAIQWSNLPPSETVPADLPEADAKIFKDNIAKTAKRVDVARAIVLGTDVPESLVSIVNREAPNMVRGMIVFTDGRSNLGTDAGYRTLRERAEREKIPIVTVAVGETREFVRIAITEVQSPDAASPDEQFKVVVEANGENLLNAETEVKLHLYLPGHDPKKDPAPDHEMTKTMKFQGDTIPPHGSVEFVVDPAKVPENLTEISAKFRNKKVLKQGEWTMVAKIDRDRREVFPEPVHVSPPRKLQVIDKPMRILLFASGPTREYLTMKKVLFDEVRAKRAVLSVYLQNDGGRDGSAQQDVEKDKMLKRFPTKLDTSKSEEKAEDKPYNLNEYDLIVCFDPDWSEMTEQQSKDLKRWVEELGGGFIFVAGPLHSVTVSPNRTDVEGGRLSPLLSLLPVELDDNIHILGLRKGLSSVPRRLMLNPHASFDILKLDGDKSDDKDPNSLVGGWEPYFTDTEIYKEDPANRQSDAAPKRGFFSYFPVIRVKPTAHVLANMLELKENGEPDFKPWMVVGNIGLGRSLFLSSGEMWRLRIENTEFYNRFWVKTTRFVTANRDAKASRGRILVNKEYVSGSQVRVQARILATNAKPYRIDEISPKFTITQLAQDGAPLKTHGPFELKARKSGDEFDGYYAGQLVGDATRFPPGDFKYRVSVDVPDSVGETITGEFSLKKSNPEEDDTRPDFDALANAASSVEEIRSRIKDPTILEKLKGTEKDARKAKLAFRLSERDRTALIPFCIDNDVQTPRNRGAVEDIWDKPARIPVGGTEVKLLELSPLSGSTQPITIGWVLFAAATLLTIEWATRKFLRLA